MRTQNALKNIAVSCGMYLLLMLIGLYTRRYLLLNFNVELVAYEGLLSNIFNLVALTDIGSYSLFSYRMFQAFAQHDDQRIRKLLGMYRALFRVIGLVSVAICAVIFFCLPLIYGPKVSLWGYFRVMYVLYAISSLSSYAIGYWRILLVAGQKERKAVSVETAIQILTQVIKIVILTTTRNYLLNLSLTTLCTVICHLWVSRRSRKEYPGIRPAKVTLGDFRAEGVLAEMKQFLFIRVSDVIYNSTDNILISLLVSVHSTALYANYLLISNSLFTLIYRVLAPIQAGLGNLLHEEGRDAFYRFYRSMDLACFFLASIIFTCYIIVYPPTISTLFGPQFLLPEGFLVCFASLYYLTMKGQGLSNSRNCFGEFGTERMYAFWSMVCNLVLSIVLGKAIGISGIIIGSVVSLFIRWQGRLLIVVRDYLKLSVAAVWGKELACFALAAAEAFAARFLVRSVPYSAVGIVICSAVGILLPTLVNLAVFWRTEAMRDLIERARNILAMRKNRGEAR